MYAVLDHNLNEIKTICKNRFVKSLYAFGSVNTDKFKSESDVDFLVEFGEMDIEEYADNYLDMCGELESLLKHPVDLVTVRSVKNPYFKKAVEKTRQLIYAA